MLYTPNELLTSAEQAQAVVANAVARPCKFQSIQSQNLAVCTH